MLYTTNRKLVQEDGIPLMKRMVVPEEFEFTVTTDSIGIPFHQPNLPSVYCETSPDGASYHRFAEMADLLEEYDAQDVVPGYDLSAPLTTLQKLICPDILERYRQQKNPFAGSLFRQTLKDTHESFPLVAIVASIPHIVDGNHRFAAARLNGLTAFAAVVVEFNHDGSQFWDVTPDEFNRRFAANN